MVDKPRGTISFPQCSVPGSPPSATPSSAGGAPRRSAGDSSSPSSAVTVFGAALVFGAWARACSGNRCPSIAGLDSYDPDQASKVYAADGRLITDLGMERRTVRRRCEEMSPALVAAFLATEDKRFYQHHGIDWVRFWGAVKANILAGGVSEGFSTITMQLARQPLSRGHQPPGALARTGRSARPRWPARSRPGTTRTRSSSSTSTRSTWATGPSGSRRRRSATSASPPAT